MWEMAGAIYGPKAVPYVHELLINSTHGRPTGPLDSHGKPTGPPTPYRYVNNAITAFLSIHTLRDYHFANRCMLPMFVRLPDRKVTVVQ